MAMEVHLTTTRAASQGVSDAELRWTGGGGQRVAFDVEVVLSETRESYAPAGVIELGELDVEGDVFVDVETPNGERASESQSFRCSLGEILAGGAAAAEAVNVYNTAWLAARTLVTQLDGELEDIEFDTAEIDAIIRGLVE